MNSKYTGTQVEALLDKASGLGSNNDIKTGAYILHDLLAFSDNVVITAEKNSGSGGASISPALPKLFDHNGGTFETLSQDHTTIITINQTAGLYSGAYRLVFNFGYQSTSVGIAVYGVNSSGKTLLYGNVTNSPHTNACAVNFGLARNTPICIDANYEIYNTLIVHITTYGGDVNLFGLMLLTERISNQGIGTHIDYPYKWDASCNILPRKSSSSLGSSSSKWNYIYAKTIKADNIDGVSSYILLGNGLELGDFLDSYCDGTAHQGKVDTYLATIDNVLAYFDASPKPVYVVLGGELCSVQMKIVSSSSYVEFDVYLNSNSKVIVKCYYSVTGTTNSWTGVSSFEGSSIITSIPTLTTTRYIDGVPFNGSANVSHYVSCSTAAGTAKKMITLTGFNVASGARLSVYMIYGNTTSSPTLSVNNGSAKSILYPWGKSLGSRPLSPRSIVNLVYNGGNWVISSVNDIDSSLKATLMYADGSMSIISNRPITEQLCLLRQRKVQKCPKNNNKLKLKQWMAFRGGAGSTIHVGEGNYYTNKTSAGKCEITLGVPRVFGSKYIYEMKIDNVDIYQTIVNRIVDDQGIKTNYGWHKHNAFVNFAIAIGTRLDSLGSIDSLVGSNDMFSVRYKYDIIARFAFRHSDDNNHGILLL